MNYEKQIIQYYKNKSARSRTPVARFLDRIVLHLLFYLFSYMWFFRQAGNSTAATILSATVTVLFAMAYYLWNKIQNESIIEKAKKEAAADYLLNQMQDMEESEFRKFIISIMETSLRPDRLSLEDSYIVGDTHGHSFIIKAVQSHPSSEITLEEIIDFYHEVKSKKVRWGIYLTLSPVSEEASSYIEHIQKVQIDIIDQKLLLSLIESSGHIPDEHLIYQKITQQVDNQKKHWEEIKKNALYPKKAKSYAIYGFVLLAASGFTGSTAYYIFLAFVCLGLSVLTFVQSRKSAKEKVPCFTLQPREESQSFSHES